jgi:hypothetical protein
VEGFFAGASVIDFDFDSKQIQTRFQAHALGQIKTRLGCSTIPDVFSLFVKRLGRHERPKNLEGCTRQASGDENSKKGFHTNFNTG